MTPQDFDHISTKEVGVTIIGSLVMGLTRFLYLLKRGRRFRWFDLLAEPCFAIVGGMLVWLMCEVLETPDLMQLLMSQLGAWGGPRTIHMLEKKYMGGSRRSDPPTGSGDL